MTTSIKRCMLLALLGCATAQAQIYKCVTPNGSIEYTDINRGSYCKSMDLPGTVIPAPPRRQGTPARSGSVPAPASTPGDFPRVDSAEQRARDADRRGILEEELKNEAQRLAELRKAFNNGEPERRGDERNYAKYQERVAGMRDNIGRSEKNIEALKREIANIR
ncbi:DUF4124 domain-containing protein [Duganella violaceipulchra]|uniref:DUF4124 domain-containing protein n=1 Tax=Duganella violaceipulchra TaxID=2849652 RepID=A0AA41HC23_9BURK|nr:DUF4124 domain-containing protein [Duganella violaceicalia]MBV6322112.1 DUF4124 domain-containing protein [Duganella violaceicalia]MCP2011259.1 hypothetical protein [Duganella violaceicalia]